jgi:hypothetical protein
MYALANPFVGHAGRAGFVALIFLIGGAVILASPRRLNLHAWPLITAGCAWAVFALLEAEATRERSNIRVDLLFTWPALCVISVGCAVTWIVLLCRSARSGLTNRSS